MNLRLYDLIFRLVGLKPREEKVLFALVRFADETGGSIHPGFEQLLHLTGYQERTLRRALARLIGKLKLVEIAALAAPGCATVYRLNFSHARLRPPYEAGKNSFQPLPQTFTTGDTHGVPRSISERGTPMMSAVQKWNGGHFENMSCINTTCGAPEDSLASLAQRASRAVRAESRAARAKALARSERERKRQSAQKTVAEGYRADPRTRHRAIQLYKQITGLYPRKKDYDRLIAFCETHREVYDETERVVLCFETWCVGSGYNALNPDWLLDWYAHGIPPEHLVESEEQAREARLRAQSLAEARARAAQLQAPPPIKLVNDQAVEATPRLRRQAAAVSHQQQEIDAALKRVLSERAKQVKANEA